MDTRIPLEILDNSDVVTKNNIDSVIKDFTGAASGKNGVRGFVPAPSQGSQQNFLRGDGTWASAGIVNQDVSSANGEYPVLLVPTANASTSQGEKSAIFTAGVTVNPGLGTIKANSFSGNISGDVAGNADTATSLANNFTISLEGDVTGSTSTNGTGTATITTVVADDSHNHVIGNIDGLQTALNGKAASVHYHDASDITSGEISPSVIPNLDASKITSGTIDIARLPAGALERCVVVQGESGRFALTTADVQTGDTVKQVNGDGTSTMYFVVDDTKLNSEQGYEMYTAGAATSVPWSGITEKPSSYNPSSHASTETTYGISTDTKYGHAMATTTTPKAPEASASLGSETAKFARGDHVHPLQTTISGNAASATELATARTIDGVDFNGTAAISHYGSCSTAADTAEKAVSVTSYKLATGSWVAVKFTVTNTAANPTLNVNSTGAKAVYYRGSAVSAGYLAANRTYLFVYNGSQYELIGDIDTNTTYSAGTGLSLSSNQFSLSDSGVSAGTIGNDSQQTPSHGGTFNIPYVTVDEKGRVTAGGTTTVKLPSDNNTDTLMTQKVSTANSDYPILAVATANAIEDLGAKTGIFASSIKLNPSTGTVTANKFSGSLDGSVTGDITGNADTATKAKGIYLVIPNETTQTATVTATVSGITEYFDGLTIAYRAPFNTAASSTLNINSLGAKPIYYKVNTVSKDYYPANAIVLLVYETTTVSTGCWKMVFSNDGNTNYYDRRNHSNAVKAADAVTAGTVIVGTSAGYKMAASGVTFDVSYPILYASDAIASGATATNTYEAIGGVNLQTTKASWTGNQYSVVFLVGTISGNTVTIDSSVFTTTVPSVADGKVYIPVGVLYSTYQIYFAPTKDVYQYTDGSFHGYNVTTVTSGTEALSWNTSVTLATVNGTAIKAKLPSNPNIDTKVNVTKDQTTKAYLLGVTTEPTTSAQAMTAVSDTAVFLDTTAGKLTATSFSGNGSALTGLNGSNISSGTVSADYIGTIPPSKISGGTLNASVIPNLDASKITSGTIDIARLPAGALERCVVVDSQADRFALTTSDVQKGDTVKQRNSDGTYTMYFVVDDTKLNSEDGYEVYTAGSATSVPWSGITGKPSSFPPSAHASTSTTYGVSSASNYGHAMASSETPLVAGTAAVGTDNGKYAREGHVHPAQTSVSGNAGTATKLATARTIDGVDFNGTAAISHYGSCSTAAATAEKAVACTGYKLVTGSWVAVKFTVTNTAANPTLNVNSTGAKAIYYRGSAVSAGYLAANRTYLFVYNGSQYELIGDIDTNNTYTAGTGLSLSSGQFSLSDSGVSAGTIGNDSQQTPSHGGTFNIPYVTVDAKGRITAGGTTTVKLPADQNVTQTVSSENVELPLLAKASNATSTVTGTSKFAAAVKLNPSTGTITATKFSGPLTGNVTGNVSGNAATATKQSSTIADGSYADVVNVGDGTNRVGTIRITNNDGSTSMLLGVHNESNGAPAGLTITNTDGTLTANFPGTFTATSISGNASSATKLATARYIDGVSFDGSADLVHYGTCSTAGSTAAKTVACTGYALKTGGRVLVKFTNTNTVASPTLNVNSTGAKNIYVNGAAVAVNVLQGGTIYEFVYNGTQYELVNGKTSCKYSTTAVSAVPSDLAEGGIIIADA